MISLIRDNFWCRYWNLKWERKKRNFIDLLRVTVGKRASDASKAVLFFFQPLLSTFVECKTQSITRDTNKNYRLRVFIDLELASDQQNSHGNFIFHLFIPCYVRDEFIDLILTASLAEKRYVRRNCRFFQ